MKELDASLQAVLRNARTALTPSARDAERVRTAVLNAHVSAVNKHDELSPGPSQAPRTLPKWIYNTGLLSLGLVVGAGLGYWAGARAQHAEQAALVAAPAPPTLVPIPDDPAQHGKDDLTGAVPPSADVTSLPVVVLARSAVMPRAVSSVRARRVASSPLDPDDEELTQLQRAERALRQGNTALATALLRALDKTVPVGRLQEERTACWTIAHCQNDAAAAEPEARAFLVRYPNTIYRRHVLSSCRINDSQSAQTGTGSTSGGH